MRRLVFPVVALAALVASSCGGWRQDDAARVNGSSIDADQLNDDVRVLLGRPAVSAVVLGPGASLTDPTAGEEGAPEGRLPTAALSGLLDRRITQVLAEEELAARGVDVTDADLAAAEASLRDQLSAAADPSSPSAGATQSGQADPGADIDSLPSDLRERLVRGDAAVARLRRELATGQLDDFPGDPTAFYTANQDDFEEFCLTVVPVADEAEGRRLAAESAAGQVALADLVSRQQGQDAGCGLGYQLREQLLPDLGQALEAAPVGRAVGPYPATDGGQILVAVSSRTPQPFADVEGDATQRYEAERSRLEDGPWSDWLAAQEPEVSIDPRYGSWDADTNRVQPPAGTRTTIPELAP